MLTQVQINIKTLQCGKIHIRRIILAVRDPYELEVFINDLETYTASELLEVSHCPLVSSVN